MHKKHERLYILFSVCNIARPFLQYPPFVTTSLNADNKSISVGSFYGEVLDYLVQALNFTWVWYKRQANVQFNQNVLKLYLIFFLFALCIYCQVVFTIGSLIYLHKCQGIVSLVSVNPHIIPYIVMNITLWLIIL